MLFTYSTLYVNHILNSSIKIKRSLRNVHFIVFGDIPVNRIGTSFGNFGNSFATLFSNFQTVYHSSSVNLYFYQQCANTSLLHI